MADLFRNRSFVFIWLGQAASGLGGQFATFIMSWMAYEITESLVVLGSILAVELFTSIFIQLCTAPYLDRWDRKNVMVLSEWLRAFAFLIPTVLFAFETLHIWHLYITAILIGIAEPLYRPSSMIYIAEILPKNRLNNANAILEGTMQTMILVGPPLAGVILQFFGAQVVLYILVGIMGGTGLLLLQLTSLKAEAMPVKVNWYKQFAEGIHFYRMNKVFLGLGLLIMIFNMGFVALSSMFLPFITKDIGGTSFQYGLFTSFLSFGMLLASLITGLKKEPDNRRIIMLSSYMIAGVFIGLLGIFQSFSILSICIFCVGFCSIIFSVNNTTLYQKYVPSHLRGRVFAVRILLSQIGIPIGALFGGNFADYFGIAFLFSVMGVLIILVAIIAFFLPVFHQLDKNTLSSILQKQTFTQ